MPRKFSGIWGNSLEEKCNTIGEVSSSTECITQRTSISRNDITKSVYSIRMVKLYCCYKYTRPRLGSKTTMTTREWPCLIHILMGSADLFGTRRERKTQNENICFQRVSNPPHATPRQVNHRFSPLCHAG